MTDLTFRKLTEDDLAALLALYAQPSFNKGRVIGLDEARAIFARFAGYPDYALYVAQEDGEVLGSFALMVIDNIAHWGMPTAMIENVVVREDRQGEGIGRAMMNAACELARAKGAYKITLSSNLQNERGHAFYEGLGFEKHGFSFRLELAPPSFPLARAAGEGRGEGLSALASFDPFEESQQAPHPTSPASGRGEGEGASPAGGNERKAPSIDGAAS